MPMYVLLSTLTPEGRRTLHERPGRLDAVNQEIESIGCRVIIQYAVLGPYDFVTVIEAPDNSTAALALGRPRIQGHGRDRDPSGRLDRRPRGSDPPCRADAKRPRGR